MTATTPCSCIANARIETFFSDHKSRGFHLHRSHLCHTARLTRLLIDSCLAYLWNVYVGVTAMHDPWFQRHQWPDRCDLSLFRLGLLLLACCLKDPFPIPSGMLIPAMLPYQPVRKWLNYAAQQHKLFTVVNATFRTSHSSLLV